MVPVTTVLTILDGNTNTVTHRSKGKLFNTNAKKQHLRYRLVAWYE